jgi:hypothetical protein
MKLVRGAELFQQELKQKSRVAQQYGEKAKFVCENQKEVEFRGDLAGMHKTLKRLQNCEKLKKDLEKKNAEERKTKRDERWAVVKENHKTLRADNRETFNYLKEKEQKMNNLISEIKAAI